MLLEVELKCGHHRMMEWLNILPRIYCPDHNNYFKPVAIECREWKWKCLGCRVARFTGQSFDNAKAAALRHHRKTGHPSQQIDFTRVPYKQDKVRLLFGRSVKTWILNRKYRERLDRWLVHIHQN